MSKEEWAEARRIEVWSSGRGPDVDGPAKEGEDEDSLAMAVGMMVVLKETAMEVGPKIFSLASAEIRLAAFLEPTPTTPLRVEKDTLYPFLSSLGSDKKIKNEFRNGKSRNETLALSFTIAIASTSPTSRFFSG